MAAARRRRRRINFKGRTNQSGPNSALFFLALIVIVETLALLFLLSERIPKKAYPKKPHVVVSKKAIVTLPKITTAQNNQAAKKEKPTGQRIEKELAKITPPKKELPLIVPIAPNKIRGRIAIVIDDWGYTLRNLDILKEMNYPLTLAILPFRDYSFKIADFAHRNNFEVIVHMSMEPKNEENVDLEPNTLTSAMSGQKMVSIMEDALKEISYAKGMNNHMGSLLTQDENAMKVVFKELKKNKLYFLDSYVTPSTVCRRVAKEVGIKFAQRSIFLDNSSNPEYIRGQLMELVSEADKNGKAIGIGHDRRSTLKVLAEVIPQLTAEGYKFVFLSELEE